MTLTSQANNFVAAINLARSEAIKRGGGITISAIDDDWASPMRSPAKPRQRTAAAAWR
jgi:Tfp pilus assembly protein FimT